MIRALTALVLLACSTPASTAPVAARPVGVLTIHHAFVSDSVRDILAADWQRHLNDRPLVERAYCVSWVYALWGERIEPAYRVTAIAPAKVDSAEVTRIWFFCPNFPNVATLHTHPPQTCLTRQGPCAPGGDYAYQCEPSDDDRDWLATTPYRFGLVQCDLHAVVAFFPHSR